MASGQAARRALLPQSGWWSAGVRPKPTVGLRTYSGGNVSVSRSLIVNHAERQLCSSGYDRIVPITDIATPPKRTFRATPPGQRNWAFQALAIAELLLDAPSSLLLDYMKRTQ
jgi:hypothetical protein